MAMTRSRLSLMLLLITAAALGFVSAPAAAEPYVLLGMYPGPLQNQTEQIRTVDAWVVSTGKRVSIGGTFMDPEYPNPAWNVPAELNGAWNAGYVPFVNLTVERSAAEIASGRIDAALTTWAGLFATWASAGRRAFIAPLPEMNGDWTRYYGRPADFVAAYRRIRQIFAAALAAKQVPETAVSWVFVPSGWSLAGDEFERFYPGHAEVDVVGFSAYNYGGCPPAAPWVKWETFDIAFRPYLDRMRLMAPGKPIFIAQTGVLDKPVNGVGDKDQWLEDTYTRLAAYPALRGILYFNLVLPTRSDLPNCPNPDFRLHEPGTTRWQGFKRALANPASNFGYWAPGSPEMRDIVFAPVPAQVFTDVIPVHPLAVDSTVIDLSPWIHALYEAGVTAGCATAPPQFCPERIVTRAEMAAFVLRAMHGPGFVPPPMTGTLFSDVPLGHGFGHWIEALAEEGITGGCGAGQYCPDGVVTRGQMAVFLIRGRHGAAYTPPPATGTVFADVPADAPFAPWIEELAAQGITAGCGTGRYCPTAGVTRQQMAVFLVRAFDL
jgi:hypothetical protein